MPELPEVETLRRGCEQHLPRRRLQKVELRRPDLRFPIPIDAVHALEGSVCREVARRSKYLLLRFAAPLQRTALIHLGMSGRLSIERTSARSQRPEWALHEHWRMDFGTRLVRYVDPRRFGMLDAFETEDGPEHKLLANLGPEPLGEDFDATHLFERSRGRRSAIKTFLMDARNVVGVGNIYASEACFRAGVRPRRAAGRILRREAEALVDAIRAVLCEAISAGGTTLRDHIDVHGEAGYFERELRVYGRAGEPCLQCGNAVQHCVQQNRATYYCPVCQA